MNESENWQELLIFYDKIKFSISFYMYMLQKFNFITRLDNYTAYIINKNFTIIC